MESNTRKQEVELEKATMIASGWSYDRTDRNGTRYYSTCKCGKCNGKGYIDVYSYIEGGICFQCNGSGVQEKPRKLKVMTPEYAEKLETKRQAKAKAEAEEVNKVFFENQGFNEDGKTYVVLGNTYEIKDELKALGAKYDNTLGWHMPQNSTEYPTIEIGVDEAYFKDWAGRYNWTNWRSVGDNPADDKIKEANDTLKRANSKSQHIGSIGEKIEKSITLKRVSSFKTNYSYYGELNFIYNFVDEDGNYIIWKTAKSPDEFDNPLEEGSVVTIKGTVKEHSEWNGELQTFLTRCKIK